MLIDIDNDIDIDFECYLSNIFSRESPFLTLCFSYLGDGFSNFKSQSLTILLL